MTDQLSMSAALEAMPLHFEIGISDGHGGYDDDDRQCANCGEDWPCPTSALIDAARNSTGAGLDVELLAEALRATGSLWSANDYYEVTTDADEFAKAIATEYARLAATRMAA